MKFFQKSGIKNSEKNAFVGNLWAAYSENKKKCRIPALFLLCGGEIGIRTLERVLAVTRFPVARLRPTQPSLHSIVAHLKAFLLYHKDPFLSRGFINFFKKSADSSKTRRTRRNSDDLQPVCVGERREMIVRRILIPEGDRRNVVL